MLAESVNPGYHGDPRELWARAYAQYITRMSNHPEMTRQLESILAGPDSPWRQWPDHEFDPILREITVMLEHKKWNPISWTAKKDV